VKLLFFQLFSGGGEIVAAQPAAHALYVYIFHFGLWAHDAINWM
jgi:hypothetical protein